MKKVPGSRTFSVRVLGHFDCGLGFAGVLMLCPLLFRNFYYDTFAVRKSLSLPVEAI